MTVRFLHTSDWQLGMTRHYLAGEAQPRFTADRVDTVRTLLALALERECSFVVVAGDVFDHANLSPQDMGRALEAMRCELPVLLLPGNHDPLGTGSLWDSPAVRDGLPDNVLLLRDSGPVQVLDGVQVVGAPWRTRKPDADPVAPALEGLEADGTVRVLVGHGMLEELDPDASSPVTVRRGPLDAALEDGRIHYVALGDRHIRWPQDGRGAIQYSGAHETTSFRETDLGLVLEVQIDPQAPAGSQVTVQDHQVGRWRHVVIERELDGPEDLEALAAELDAQTPKERTMVKTALRGALTVGQAAQLDELLESQGARFASLEAWDRHTDIVILPSQEEMQEISLGGFAQQTLEELRERAWQPERERAEDGSPEPIAAEELSEQAEQEEMLREPAPPAEHETAQDALRLLVRLSGGQRA